MRAPFTAVLSQMTNKVWFVQITDADGSSLCASFRYRVNAVTWIARQLRKGWKV